MGNKQTREEEEVRSQSTDTQRQRLTTVFRELVENDTEGRTVLDRNSFCNKLFKGRNQEFADLLYRSAVKQNDKSSSHMNDNDFITLGQNLWQLTDRMQQLQWYFKLFSNDGKVSKEGMLKMLYNTCLITFTHVGMDLSQEIQEDDPVFAAMIAGVFGQTKDFIEWSDFKRWSTISCAGLFQGLHMFTLNAVLGSAQPHSAEASAWSEVVSNIESKSALLSWTQLWALCATLSQVYVYFPSADVSSTTSSSGLASTPDLPLEVSIGHGGWQQLYSSNKDGLSVTRFKTKVLDYKGPSIMLFSFKDAVYALALDEEWRESTERLGGVHSALVQILPQYKYMQGGAPLLYFNLTNRAYPQNISVGKTPQTTFIKVDSEFSKVSHYGIDFNLAALEVWGCASKAVRKSQLEQQQWNEREAEKYKNQKLKIAVEEWKDSPDRQILGMAGVKTEHAER